MTVFRIVGALILSAFLAAPAMAALSDEVTCGGTRAPFCFVNETGLPLRLLVKPQSNLYADHDENSAQVTSNITAFSSFYAFEMLDVDIDENNFAASGWFRVGADTAGPEGYLRAQDVVVWKQALAVAFTNPGVSERKPVLMFANGKALDDALTDIENGTTTADKIYEDVDAGHAPPGIVSREGKAWVDIDQTFYLLPILAYSDLHMFWPEGLLGLQVAALTNQARSAQSNACDLHAAGADQCLQQQAGSVSNVALDVVFVVDMTNSMQPYIDAVASAIRSATQGFAQHMQNEDKLKFGLVGYRDEVESSPGLEWVTKNFTPDLLSSADFAALMNSGQVKVADVGSGDFPEEVFAGVKAGISSNWSQESARAIILIGDASSHPLGDPKNTSGLSEQAVRELADEESVRISSIYVGDADGSDTALATPQFRTIAVGDEGGASGFAIVGPGSEGSLETSLRDIIAKIADFLVNGNLGSISGSNIADTDTAAQAVGSAVRAALVDYIGADAQPPSNITAWVLDHDPTDYKKKAFDVKVMVGRGDLQELTALLEGLVTKFQAGQSSTSGLFAAVQTGATSTAYDLPIEETKPMINSDVIPRWIKSLPYKSEILSMSLEEFRQSPPDDRTRIERRLEDLIQLYKDTFDRATAWVALNDQGTAEDRVYMLDLANLP